MSRQDLLTIFFGERDRTPSGWLSDAIGRLAAEHHLRASVVLRGTSGYGPHHVQQSDVELSLSDDLPLVMLAFDDPDRLDAFHRALLALHSHAHVSRTTGTTAEHHDTAPRDGQARLVALVGRHDRRSKQPAHRAVIDVLHHQGAAGATALLGVDGTRDGQRTRSGLLARNARTPTAVISVGERDIITHAARQLAREFPGAAVLVQDATILKRDGHPVSDPRQPEGEGAWQLAVHAGVASRHDGRPLDEALLNALRQAGATGATALRGIWGFHGDHAPHGDAFWALRRTVPLTVLTTSHADVAPAAWKAIDAVTDQAGLVVAQHASTQPPAADSARAAPAST